MARLGDVFDRQITGEWGNECTENENSTKILRTTNFTSEGNINYNDVVARSIREDKVIDKRLRYGDIILEKSGGTEKTPVGRVVFCDDSIEKDIYLCNNFTQAMRVRKNLAIPRYVFYFMWNLHYSGKTDLLQNKTTGIRNLQVKSYLNENIPLPPLDEQRKIAAVVDKVSDLIAKRRQQLDKLDTLVKARFVEMFGDFVYDRNRWQICEIGDVADTIDPQPSHRTPPISSDGVPYIGIAECNYKTHFIDFDKARKVGQNVLMEHLERYSLSEGDFIIGKIGTIGKPFFIPAKQNYTLSANTVLIKPIKDKVVPQFLFAIFQSEYMGRIIDAEKKSTSQPAFGIQKVRRIEIPMPPMALQEQFAAFGVQVDKLKLAIQRSCEALETLKKALMQKYFK